MTGVANGAFGYTAFANRCLRGADPAGNARCRGTDHVARESVCVGRGAGRGAVAAVGAALHDGDTPVYVRVSRPVVGRDLRPWCNLEAEVPRTGSV